MLVVLVNIPLSILTYDGGPDADDDGGPDGDGDGDSGGDDDVDKTMMLLAKDDGDS